MSLLSASAPKEYILGRDDVLKVEIYNLFPGRPDAPRGGAAAPAAGLYSIEVTVTGGGEVLLPLVGAVRVGGMTLAQAQQAITKAYAGDFIDEPRLTVSLFEKATTSVMVLGEVARPDVYDLPKYHNDIAHAISRAGGLTDDAGLEIEVHRKVRFDRIGSPPRGDIGRYPIGPHRLPPPDSTPAEELGPQVLRIPLRSNSPMMLTRDQVVLNDGDVVVVPSRTNEVFFVVGKLSSTNFVRFSLGRENRDLGTGFLLPRDRDVDVVTAVSMAGYIDPIDSPTTVTVHRTLPDGQPMLIHVDLIAARYDRKENVMVQPGDIIYLNPDAHWWFRRTIDRVIPDLIVFPYERAMLRAFGQERQ